MRAFKSVEINSNRAVLNERHNALEVNHLNKPLYFYPTIDAQGFEEEEFENESMLNGLKNSLLNLLIAIDTIERDTDVEANEDEANNMRDDEEIYEEQRNNIDLYSKERERLYVNINRTNYVICNINIYS